MHTSTIYDKNTIFNTHSVGILPHFGGHKGFKTTLIELQFYFDQTDAARATICRHFRLKRTRKIKHERLSLNARVTLNENLRSTI